jgi:hypothetical protein
MGALALSDPESSISYQLGIGVGILLPLIFAGMAAATVSGPNRSRKCALSLAMLMGGWFLASLGYGVGQWTGLTWVPILFGIIAAPVALGAGILAIVGLSEVVGNPRPLRGSWQGIASLVLVGIFGLCIVVGFLSDVTKAVAARQIPKDWRMSQTPPGQALDFPAKSFRYTVPGGDWVQVLPQKLNPKADLAFVDPTRKLYFMVLAHKIAPGVDLPQEKFLEIARNELKQLDPGAVVSDSQPETLGPVAGSAFGVEATLQNQSFTYREWVGIHGGHAYQLVAWGFRSNRASVAPAAAGLFQNFGVIPP